MTETSKREDAVGIAQIWADLAAPFPPEDVEHLPKQLRRDDSVKGRCERPNTGVCADDKPCGGWHAKSIHLAYIGHAGITTRLNEVVGPENWTLEPYAHDQYGLPMMGHQFWVKLTVLGVTKMEIADNYKNAQEALGDGLRRAAMRFGIGTYLWSKSERAGALAEFRPDAEPEQQPQQQPYPDPPHQQGSNNLDDIPMTEKTRSHMFGLFHRKGVPEEQQLPGINHITGSAYDSRGKVTEGDALRVIAVLERRPDVPLPAAADDDSHTNPADSDYAGVHHSADEGHAQ